jgi:hypothetical protein
MRDDHGAEKTRAPGNVFVILFVYDGFCSCDISKKVAGRVSDNNSSFLLFFCFATYLSSPENTEKCDDGKDRRATFWGFRLDSFVAKLDNTAVIGISMQAVHLL